MARHRFVETAALLARYEKSVAYDIEHVSFLFLFSRIDKRVEGTWDYRDSSQCHCPSGLFDTYDDNIPASSLFTAYVHVDLRGWNITELLRARAEARRIIGIDDGHVTGFGPRS